MSPVSMAFLVGAGTGLGVLLVWYALFPPRPTLAAALSDLQAPPGRPRHGAAAGGGWASRAGLPLVPALRAAGMPRIAIGDDLAICGQRAEMHLAEQAAAGLTGLLLPPALAAVAAAAGEPWPWAIPAWASIALAAAGFLLPDLRIRAEARRRRDDFDYALSAWLDLTVITLASGAGVEQALTHAAATGRGWVFTQLRQCLDVAATTRRPLWEPLEDLATTLRVTSVRELAAALRLAGEEGARVRASLTSRAAALRVRQRTTAEARARAAGERMSLPVVTLMVAFLAFLLYPAISTVLTDL